MRRGRGGKGNCLFFGQFFGHEAWIHGAQPRMCLLTDLWPADAPRARGAHCAVTEICGLTDAASLPSCVQGFNDEGMSGGYQRRSAALSGGRRVRIGLSGPGTRSRVA
ncbi:aspartyl/asparaginyl beta-hydroxylase domain-containing protein [Streptomyces sp. NBC_01217]|uniref:aspartyl/asparaginyl beta-hydroxylase domain-containing protein n=1 Tax=Streptomyces sp. NBC_01217 TaxID=2903779 RepID=UPI003FA3A431